MWRGDLACGADGPHQSTQLALQSGLAQHTLIHVEPALLSPFGSHA